jgi:hypothetical protein
MSFSSHFTSVLLGEVPAAKTLQLQIQAVVRKILGNKMHAVGEYLRSTPEPVHFASSLGLTRKP